MEALIPLSKALTITDAFSVRKWETFFPAFGVHTSNVYMEVPLVLREKSSLDLEKQTARRIFRTSPREVTGFEPHVGLRD